MHLGAFIADLLGQGEAVLRLILAGIHSVGEGGHLVEVHLGPLVEGVVVALGALEADAEENADGVRHVVEGHAAVADVVADRAIVPDHATGRNEFADELS